MKILLLDRADESGIGSEIEFFGPWAQVFKYPNEIEKPSFNPYQGYQDVHKVYMGSYEAADRILEELREKMPSWTGVYGKSDKFWNILLSHMVVTMCGAVGDVEQRRRALPDEEYILGAPVVDDGFDYPKTFADSKGMIFRDNRYRTRIAFQMLSGIYSNHVDVDYLYDEVVRVGQSNSASLAKRIYYGAPAKMRSFLKKLRVKLSTVFQNKSKVTSILWDNYDSFIDIRDGSYVYRETVVGRRGSKNSKNQVQFDAVMRNEIRDSFGFPYGNVLSEIIPYTALEGLKSLSDSVDLSGLELYPNISKIYSQDRALVDSDYWRVAAALLADQGIEVVSYSHGAMTYYTHPLVGMTRHALDGYISWGMTDWYDSDNQESTPGCERPKALPSVYLSRLRERFGEGRVEAKWDVTFLFLYDNKKIKWLYTPLFPDLAYDYYRREKVLLDNFRDNDKCVVKLYPKEYGWNQKDWILDKYPKLVCAYAEKNFLDYAVSSKLIIVDYNSTGFLELLVLEFPFLCTWDRNWFRGNEKFEECLSQLAEVGIFYEDPAELIDNYNNHIRSDVDQWWNQEFRIKAVREFASNFAMTSGDWRDQWSSEFKTKSYHS